MRNPRLTYRVGRAFHRAALLCFFAVTVMLLSPSSPFAGEYHATKEETFSKTTETLVCSQCHTMHGTQGGQSMIYGGSPVVNKALIRAATIVQLCRTCHENNSLSMSSPTPPDIWNNTLGYTASGGDFADRGEINEQNRHSVDSNDVTPPGSDPPITISYFNCENCHDQHGNKNYRNLKYRPGNASSDITVSYVLDPNGSKTCSDGVATEPCDVSDDTVSNPLGQANLTKFQRSNVSFRRVSSDTSGIAAWCGSCHTKFHGVGGASNMGGSTSGDTGNPWVRHPVRDVNINEANSNLHADRSNWAGVSSSVRVRAVNPDGAAPTSGNADEQPFCLTCHYAHGGGNPHTDATYDHTNLVTLDSAGRLNLDSLYDTSTGYLRNVCQQCHNQ